MAHLSCVSSFGVDMAHILALQKRYGFYLQVEDPERLWSTDPLRYIHVGQTSTNNSSATGRSFSST